MFRPNSQEDSKIKLAIIEEKLSCRDRHNSEWIGKMTEAIEKLTGISEKLSLSIDEQTARITRVEQRAAESKETNNKLQKQYDPLLPLQIGRTALKILEWGAIIFIFALICNVDVIERIWNGVFYPQPQIESPR